MFKDIDLLYIFGPALVIASIFLFVINKRRKKQKGFEINKAIAHFKMTSIVFGALLIILWLSLPSTPSLKTFGYPEDISAISRDEKVLKLFQDYNKAIVRTAEVLHWFLFLFIFWFLSTLLGVTQVYKEQKEKPLPKH